MVTEAALSERGNPDLLPAANDGGACGICASGGIGGWCVPAARQACVCE